MSATSASLLALRRRAGAVHPQRQPRAPRTALVGLVQRLTEPRRAERRRALRADARPLEPRSERHPARGLAVLRHRQRARGGHLHRGGLQGAARLLQGRRRLLGRRGAQAVEPGQGHLEGGQPRSGRAPLPPLVPAGRPDHLAQRSSSPARKRQDRVRRWETETLPEGLYRSRGGHRQAANPPIAGPNTLESASVLVDNTPRSSRASPCRAAHGPVRSPTASGPSRASGGHRRQRRVAPLFLPTASSRGGRAVRRQPGHGGARRLAILAVRAYDSAGNAVTRDIEAR